VSARTLERVYSPRGTAKALFGVRAPEVLLSGPAGTGKSRACLEKLHHICLINPNVRVLVVRKTFTSLKASAVATYETHVAPQALLDGTVIKRVEQPQYRYSNGSSITLGGMDNVTRIMSTEYDIVYVQEAIELSEDEWETLTTRLRNGAISFQQLIADTNPSYPTHWLKQRGDRGQTVVLESRHEDNPVYFTSDGQLTDAGSVYISRLDNLTGVRYLRLRKGIWAGAEGMIYEEWDPAVHVLDAFPIPPEWSRWWSVDFGVTNPFVCQMWAEDEDGRLYLYREVYKTKRGVVEHAERILDLVTDDKGEWTEPKPQAIICDHDANGRQDIRRTLDIATQPAKKDVLTGIEAVQRRLRRNDIDGRPRLFVLKGARVGRDQALVEAKKPTSTEEEFPGYVWDQKEAKESPVKENDHGMDALRYMVMHRERVSEGIRWVA
jgi:PBSX family phage terminase large subunit